MLKTSKSAVLVVCVCGAFVTPFMGSSINVALPSIARDFSMDAVSMSWVATSYLLSAAAFLVPLGRFSDIFGRKKVYTAGMAIFALASVLASTSGSTATLLVFRVLQGVGSAMIFSTSMAIISSVFPLNERGFALGTTVAATYIGLSIGPFLGGVITQSVGWRGVFFINVPIGLITILLVFLTFKDEWAEARGESFDVVGALLYIFMIVSFIYGVSIVPDPLSLAFVAAAAVGLTMFIRWEDQCAFPVFNINLLRGNRVFALSSVAALLHYSATFGVTFLLSLYLQNIRGFSPQTAGLILVTQPVVMALFSPAAGYISDRSEPRIVASVGMFITAAGLLSFTMLDDETSLLLVVIRLATLGFGFALFSSPNMNAIMSSVEKRYYGLASGAVAAMRLIGQMLSMATATVIFSIIIGRVTLVSENHHLFMKSMDTAFLVFGISCGLGVFASMARGNLRRTELSPGNSNS